jgi:hypothetical protein
VASTDRSETRPVAPLLAADVVIQPWLAVDPGQGWECLVAGGSECAASILILEAEEDVGGLAMREIFLARLSRRVPTLPGRGMIRRSAAPWLFSLPATSTGGAQTYFDSLRNKTRRPRQWKTSDYRERLGRSSLLARQRRPRSGLSFARAVLSARKLAGVSCLSAAIVSALLFL